MPPGFTAEEEAFIQLVAQKVAAQIAHDILERHIATCPWGKGWTRLYYVGCGLLIGSGLLNIAAASKLLLH